MTKPLIEDIKDTQVLYPFSNPPPEPDPQSTTNTDFRMEQRAPRLELSIADLEQIYTKEFITFLREGIPVGGCVYLKGSTASIYTAGKLGPTDNTGQRHIPRSSDIDLYSQSAAVHYGLMKAATHLSGEHRDITSNYTGTSKFVLTNGIHVDLNEGVKTAESLQAIIELLINTVEQMDSVGIDVPTMKSFMLQRFKQMLFETQVTPFDPKHLLHLNGFMPLESPIIQVKKAQSGDLETAILDPYQIISRSRLVEQAETQRNLGNAYGHVFPEAVMGYSPFYIALCLEFAREKNEKVIINDKTLCVDIYANLLKMAREHVEGNTDIVDPQVIKNIKDPKDFPKPALGEGSPIPYAAASLGFEDLVIRPQSEEDYAVVLQKLRKRAQLEFARSAASDTNEAILTFFIDYPFGGLIYPRFRDNHYLNAEVVADNEYLEKLNLRNHYFTQRLALLGSAFYPPHKLQAISTINPHEYEQIKFMADKTAASISEVMAMVLVADGYNADTCNEVVEELLEHWQPDQVLTQGWFYGDSENFNAQLSRDEIVEHIKRFQLVADLPNGWVQEAQA